MLHQSLLSCLRETAFRLVLKEPYKPRQVEECFLNPPCGCANPGKDLRCEDCSYLEACLSECKTSSSSRSNVKLGSYTKA